MRLLVWIITLPVTIVLVLFAVSNRQDVQLWLWPFDAGVQLPLFLVVLGSAVVGFFIGAFMMWASLGSQRRSLRVARSHARALEREVARFRGQRATKASGTALSQAADTLPARGQGVT